MTETRISTAGNFRESIRVSLDWLATEDHIQWGDDDWGVRYNSFFSALASWENGKGTLQSGLEAAFVNLPDHARIGAMGAFHNAFNADPRTQRAPRKKRSPGATVKKAIDALKS